MIVMTAGSQLATALASTMSGLSDAWSVKCPKANTPSVSMISSTLVSVRPGSKASSSEMTVTRRPSIGSMLSK